MPYVYNKKKVHIARLLEIVAYCLLLPLKLKNGKRKGVPPRILLIEPFQMGDVLSLMPLIDPLRKGIPDAEIYILTKPSSGGILEFDTRIKRVIKQDFPWSDYGQKKSSLSKYLRVLRNSWSLRSFDFELGIDTRGDIRSQILMALTGCKSRIGYRNYLHSNLTTRGLFLSDSLLKSKYLHRYEWNLELLKLIGCFKEELIPIHFPAFFPVKLNQEKECGEIYFVIHIGGGWEYKRWSIEKWVNLIQLMLSKFTGKITVIAGPSERDQLDQIERLVLSGPMLEFKLTSLEDLTRFISACHVFVGLDSGPMNLAVCLGKKVISLFGPGDSIMWKPLTKGSGFIHKVDKFSCNPCLQTTCYFPKRNCMSEIEAKEVIGLIQTVVN